MKKQEETGKNRMKQKEIGKNMKKHTTVSDAAGYAN